ncbi:MAG: class I SAM-dependent methyltransferase [bacterium]|nr:class I SAM-dependent methyltransferase [bacterium]
MTNKNTKFLTYIKTKPSLYKESSSAFWNDEHISKYMLEAHLDPDGDAASRKLPFIKASVEWITNYCDGGNGKTLLDLGCGPGIYAELFTEQGFKVTGIDLSKRSIEYAKQHALKEHKEIQYYNQNYLEITYKEQFDVITLIYCDFGVLSSENRQTLLKNAWKALKPGGIVILDAFTESYLHSFEEKESITYHENGFWCSKPYAVIQRNRYYKDTKNTLEQYIVVTDADCSCYNIWNQLYTDKSLASELENAHFQSIEYFADVTGKKFSGLEPTICAAAKK